MKAINEWMDHLKKRQIELKKFIEREYKFDTKKLIEVGRKTIFSDYLRAKL